MAQIIKLQFNGNVSYPITLTDSVINSAGEKLTDVIAAIQQAAQSQSTQISDIATDYLKAADKTELINTINALKLELIGSDEDTQDSMTIKGVRKYAEALTEGIATEGAMNALSERVGTVENDLSEHISNSEMHVTQALQDKWNETSTKVDTFLDAEGLKETTLDTLKEILDYILNNTAEAADLLVKINQNTENIETLNESVVTSVGLTTSDHDFKITSSKEGNTVTLNTSEFENALATLLENFETHSSNEDIHVTISDKESWNAKVDAEVIVSDVQEVEYTIA